MFHARPRKTMFPKLSSAFTLEHAAFADFEGMGQFVGEGEHGHLAHIGPAGDADADNAPLSAVPVMTVDSLVEREGLLSIDILKSDCEGAWMWIDRMGGWIDGRMAIVFCHEFPELTPCTLVA